MYTIIKGNKRQRYIGFVIKNLEKNLNKSVISDEIRKKSKKMFNKDCKEMGIQLLRFTGSTGIVKCHHLEKENTILLLKSIKQLELKKVELVPIATSGTIRSLIKKYMSKNI